MLYFPFPLPERWGGHAGGKRRESGGKHVLSGGCEGRTKRESGRKEERVMH